MDWGYRLSRRLPLQSQIVLWFFTLNVLKYILRDPYSVSIRTPSSVELPYLFIWKRESSPEFSKKLCSANHFPSPTFYSNCRRTFSGLLSPFLQISIDLQSSFSSATQYSIRGRHYIECDIPFVWHPWSLKAKRLRRECRVVLQNKWTNKPI